MKIYIAQKGESFEQTLSRNECTFETYKGHYITGRWNGFEIKGIVLGYKFNTIEEVKKYIDRKEANKQKVNSIVNEWPDNRR